MLHRVAKFLIIILIVFRRTFCFWFLTFASHLSNIYKINSPLNIFVSDNNKLLANVPNDRPYLGQTSLLLGQSSIKSEPVPTQFTEHLPEPYYHPGQSHYNLQHSDYLGNKLMAST